MAITPEMLGNLLQLIIINLVLSGDNAVVIGMAAHPLPRRQRRLAIAFGGGAAIALRVVLTAAAALVLSLPAVKLIGGLLLLWIAFQLLEEPGDARTSAHDRMGLRAAITTILVADLIMSLDNVLGVAAASNGNVGLLIFGTVISMLIVMLGGGVFAELIDRLWWLTYAGSAIIAWTGLDMALADGVLRTQPPVAALSEPARLGITLLGSLAVVGAAHLAHRRPAAARNADKLAAPRRSVY
jgi:YjbE family integral membrane protein